MSERYSVDATVIGAGVVGLACARQLAAAGLSTVLLEREGGFGHGVSSRNSEVIHAGLYYPAGGWKARLCRAGRERLYDYCAQRGVAHRRIGKWLVATTDEQIVGLETIARAAAANGVDDLAWIDAATARRIEPALRCAAVLASPSTGIIDSHGLMSALADDFERADGMLVLQAPLRAAHCSGDGFELEIDDSARSRLQTRYLINAAGLDAPHVATMIDGLPLATIPARCYAKGNYFVLQGRSPFSRLIYPLPEAGGLGVHLTLDLQGSARFGPDVEWVDAPDYIVDPQRAAQFHAAICRYWPECPLERLAPGYAGVRPKLGSPQAFADDFIIQSAAVHGCAGLVNLFGIESPGLTACLTLAHEAMAQLGLADSPA